jgi:hypothetical protein
MLDLSQQALFTFSQDNACDTEHPVVMDQVFGVQMQHLSNKKKANSLKHRIKKLTNRVHAISGFKTVELDSDKADRIIKSLTHELFDVFTWNRVKTATQASWKEYFHMLYELVVYNDTYHSNNVVISRAVVKYHDVLKVPDHIPHSDPMYPVVSSVSHLFTELKAEQVATYKSLKNVKEHLKGVQVQTTELQHVLVALKREQKELEEDNAKYMHIMRWSAQ